MVSRRQFLSTASVALAITTATAGCSTRQGPTDPTAERTATDTRTETPSDEPSATTKSKTETETETETETDTESDSDSNGLADWAPTWTLRAEAGAVRSIRVVGDRVVALASGGSGPTDVFAIDGQDGSRAWRTQLDGGPESGSHLSQSNARDDRSITVTDDALYVLTGNADEYEWTALTALDPATGAVDWSLKQEQDLAVAGVRDGSVVVGGREFFEPQTSHDTPEDPLRTVLYGIDAATGDVRWSRQFRAVSVATTGPDGAVVAADRRVIGLGRDGRERWSVETTGPVRAVCPVGDLVVAAVEAGDGSTLRAFGPDGTEAWRLRRPVESFLATTDRLYALGEATLGIDPTGTVRWQVDGYGGWPLLSPDGRTLYARAGVQAAAVDAFDLPEGGRRFRYETPSNNGWPTAAANGFVAAEAITPDAADFTSLFAVDAASGTATAVYRPTASVYGAAGTSDRIYVGVGRGLLAFDEP